MPRPDDRPQPSDFDPFIRDGAAVKVCVECFETFPLEDFKGEDGKLHKVCIWCDPKGEDWKERTEEVSVVGERITEGFQIMGGDDD
jgi:hypothetical protein